MKIFLFGELTTENIVKICPECTVLEKLSVFGYDACISDRGRSYIRKGTGSVSGFVIDVSGIDLWHLDQWKGVLLLQRNKLTDKQEEIFSYFSMYDTEIEGNGNIAGETEIDAFRDRFLNNKSLKMADIHLLIPGHISIISQNNETVCLGKMLQDSIRFASQSEFKSDFFKDCKRYTLGSVEINYGDGVFQSAVLTLMCHNGTRLCVMDIYIPAIEVSTHRLLFRYCGGTLKLRYKGKEVNINELCKMVGITQYGCQRSLVFSYEKLDEERLLNLLVNEEEPMGKIIGSYFKNVISNNLAQYDTAEVYATEVTMLEMTDRVENDVTARIGTQALEIFFVEMLLLQDAAVSKMYDCVQKEIAAERENPLRKDADKTINELADDSAYAINFTDYQQFYFPTVRVSAESVAKAFGIDSIREKYSQNKVLLEQMIKNHEADIAKKENSIKNNLLVIITLLSGTETIFGAFNAITNSAYESVAYYVSLLVMLAGVLIYLGATAIIRRRAIKQARARLMERRYENQI